MSPPDERVLFSCWYFDTYLAHRPGEAGLFLKYRCQKRFVREEDLAAVDSEATRFAGQVLQNVILPSSIEQTPNHTTYFFSSRGVTLLSDQMSERRSASGYSAPSAEEVLQLVTDASLGLESLNAISVGHFCVTPYTLVSRRKHFALLSPFASLASQMRHLTKFPCLSLYSSPEVLRGEHPSLGSDLWSLGVVAYEFFTGRLPFTSLAQIVCYSTQNFHYSPLHAGGSAEGPEPPAGSALHSLSLKIQTLLMLDAAQRLAAQTDGEFSEVLPFAAPEGARDLPFQESLEFSAIHLERQNSFPADLSAASFPPPPSLPASASASASSDSPELPQARDLLGIALFQLMFLYLGEEYHDTVRIISSAGSVWGSLRLRATPKLFSLTGERVSLSDADSLAEFLGFTIEVEILLEEFQGVKDAEHPQVMLLCPWSGSESIQVPRIAVSPGTSPIQSRHVFRVTVNDFSLRFFRMEVLNFKIFSI